MPIIHWSRASENGKRSQAYDELVESVAFTIRQNGSTLVNGGVRIVAERVVYELVDVLGMMPESAARELIEKLASEAGLDRDDDVDALSRMTVASAG